MHITNTENEHRRTGFFSNYHTQRIELKNASSSGKAKRRFKEKLSKKLRNLKWNIWHTLVRSEDPNETSPSWCFGLEKLTMNTQQLRWSLHLTFFEQKLFSEFFKRKTFIELNCAPRNWKCTHEVIVNSFLAHLYKKKNYRPEDQELLVLGQNSNFSQNMLKTLGLHVTLVVSTSSHCHKTAGFDVDCKRIVLKRDMWKHDATIIRNNSHVLLDSTEKSKEVWNAFQVWE